jgi:hypothetical protein
VLPEGGVQVTVGLVSTASVAVTDGQLTAAPPGPVAGTPVKSPGRPTREGAPLSWTVTVNVADAEFVPSVAVHVTVVVPSGKVEPEVGVHVGVTGPTTMSFADAENETAAPEASVAGAVMSAGGEMLGGVESTTVTVNVVCPCVLSVMSVAVHVTSVEPSGNTSPELWSQAIA